MKSMNVVKTNNINKVLKLALAEINHYYGDKCAKRSGVPLINHINEGIAILQSIGADEEVQAAFALHPITQNEDIETFNWSYKHKKIVVVFAEQYAEIANSYLCRPETDHIQSSKDLKKHLKNYSVIEIIQMLYADKVQNRKDFQLYHLGTHERSDQLERYFDIWIDYLKKRLP